MPDIEEFEKMVKGLRRLRFDNWKYKYKEIGDEKAPTKKQRNFINAFVKVFPSLEYKDDLNEKDIMNLNMYYESFQQK